MTEFIYRFPTGEDAEAALFTLSDAGDGICSVKDICGEAIGDSVIVMATVTEADEPGLVGGLDNWASSTGGYAA